MNNDEHILISLEARHAENILDGKKLVELRRRPMNVSRGATVWIYAKLPVGSIVGSAVVSAIHVQTPSTLWRRFGPVCGITRTEFLKYFEGVEEGTALELSDCKRWIASFSLKSLRQFNSRFQPPQFFARLKQGTPLLAAICRPS
jgi:predicted transcriptional regulator